MVIKQNERDFVYPEYPVPSTNLKRKIVQNMWRKFIENKKEDYPKIFQIEEEIGGFRVETFVKNKDDCFDIKQYLIENMESLLAYQKLLMIQSHRFPYINWDAINDSIVGI